MKKIFLTFFILSILSCSKEEIKGSEDNDLIQLELNKNFLLGEKWYLYSAVAFSDVDINGNGQATKNLESQFPKCDLDSYYVFEKNQPNIAVLVDGLDECEDNFERFGSNIFSFQLIKSEKKLNIDTDGFELLGGLKNNNSFNQISFLQNVEFFISPDSSFKILKGEIQLIQGNGEIVIVEYSLRSNLNNRT